MYDITALGELLIDWTPAGVNADGVPLFAQNPGGAPANLLAQYTKLGGKTAFIGKVGDDQFGRSLSRTLQEAGIDTAGLVVDTAIPTTLAFVHLDTTGNRSFSFYRKPGADMMLKPDEVNTAIIAASRHFHFGAVSLTDEPCRSAVYTAVKAAKACSLANSGATVSYDPNYRALLWSSEHEAITEMKRPLPQTDILKVSDEEIRLMTGIDGMDSASLAKAASVLADQGPAVVVVSLGPRGAFYWCADGSGSLPTYDVKTINTTGAGDSFFGAALWRMRGKDRAALEKISRDELEDITRFANAAGSVATTRNGAIQIMPTLQEIEQCVKSVPLLS